MTKHFIVCWERIGNAGYALVDAPTAPEAVKRLGFSPKFCKMTAFELVNEEEYSEGVIN